MHDFKELPMLGKFSARETSMFMESELRQALLLLTCPPMLKACSDGTLVAGTNKYICQKYLPVKKLGVKIIYVPSLLSDLSTKQVRESTFHFNYTSVV